MFNKLKQLIEVSLAGSGPDSTPQNQQRLSQLAATALLLEVGHADHHMAPEETAEILSIVQETFAINDQDIEEFFSDAEQQKHDSTSLYEFTGIINSSFDERQKYELIGQLWRIAYIDGEVDRYEDHTIRKVAELIYVSHSDFIKAKLEIASSQST